MTDKQIMIDGINVSECEFYEPKAQVMTCHEENITKRCDKTNCYFKQLARKTQECEDLKKEKRNFHNFLTNPYNYGSFRPMWGAYLLKRFFKEDLGDFFDEKAYKMADTIEEKEKQLNKYSQALTEIKEIASKSYFTKLELKDCIECDNNLAKILQIIDKVER